MKIKTKILTLLKTQALIENSFLNYCSKINLEIKFIILMVRRSKEVHVFAGFKLLSFAVEYWMSEQADFQQIGLRQNYYSTIVSPVVVGASLGLKILEQFKASSCLMPTDRRQDLLLTVVVVILY